MDAGFNSDDMESNAIRRKRSGVKGFEIHRLAIVGQFLDGDTYLYDAENPGMKHGNAMKEKASAGRGLATYISKHVRTNFVKKPI